VGQSINIEIKETRAHNYSNPIQINEEDTSEYSVDFFYFGDDTIKIIDILSDGNSLSKSNFENSIKIVDFPSVINPHSGFTVKLLILPIGCSGDFYRRINFYIFKKGYSQNFSVRAYVIPTLSKNLEISKSIDLGVLKRGDTINYNINYKNIGNDTIKLLQPCDRCSLNDFSKVILAPNETGYITIKEETCKMDSLWEKYFNFKTNISGNYVYKIRVQASFKKFIHLIIFEEDSFFYSFDSTEKTLRHDFIFKNISNRDIFINRVSTGDGGTIAQTENREAIEPGEESKIIMMWNLSGRPINYRVLCISYITKEKNECGCSNYPDIYIKTVVKDKCLY